MSKKLFKSATLQSDGTAVVTGPFSLEPGDPQKPALVAFYLVQGSTTVGGGQDVGRLATRNGPERAMVRC